MIIGNIQNLPIGLQMLQCVTSIKKFTKNSYSPIVIVCPINAQTVFRPIYASSRHSLQLVWALVFSAILTAVV